MGRSVARGARDRGAAAVELALVLPFFLLLVFGIIQYGWTFYQTQETAQAVREGARIAAVGEMDESAVETHVANQVLSATGEQVCVFYTDSPDDVDDLTGKGKLDIGDVITVRARFAATDFNLPFLPFPNGLHIDEVAVTRAEDPPTSTYPTSCDF